MTTSTRCELLADALALGLAVGDERDLGAAAPEVAGGLLAHLAGAQQEDRAAFEAAEDLLRERGGRRRHRGGALADRRLGPHLPAGVERLAEDPVEQRPGRAELVRDPHLAEDLALARNERVETRGDAEEVVRRGPVLQPVERRLDLRAERRERRDRSLLGLLRVVGGEVELGAVAGREADRLAPVRGEPGRQRLRVVAVERDLLAQLDRRVVVGGADEDEVRSCEVGRRKGEPDDDDEDEAGEREIGGAASRPAAEQAQAEIRAPDEPCHGRHGDERVEPVVPGQTAARARPRRRASAAAPTRRPSAGRASRASRAPASACRRIVAGRVRSRRSSQMYSPDSAAARVKPAKAASTSPTWTTRKRFE